MQRRRRALDGALIALLRAAGLRRAEVCALDVDDYNPAAGVLTVRHGKRNKDREIPIGNGTADALADWLMVRGDAPGPLFVPVNRGGRIEDQAEMHPDAIFAALAKRAAAAGVSDLSLHDLRRTFASDLLDGGAGYCDGCQTDGPFIGGDHGPL